MSTTRRRWPRPFPERSSFVYPGTEHYFAEHDDQATALLSERVRAFLG
jgi:hypothetical protein